MSSAAGGVSAVDEKVRRRARPSARGARLRSVTVRRNGRPRDEAGRIFGALDAPQKLEVAAPAPAPTSGRTRRRRRRARPRRRRRAPPRATRHRRHRRTRGGPRRPPTPARARSRTARVPRACVRARARRVPRAAYSRARPAAVGHAVERLAHDGVRAHALELGVGRQQDAVRQHRRARGTARRRAARSRGRAGARAPSRRARARAPRAATRRE